MTLKVITVKLNKITIQDNCD